MAAADKFNNGKRKDYAKHYSSNEGGEPICNNKNYGYSTNNIEDVDCRNCCKLIKKGMKLYC